MVLCRPSAPGARDRLADQDQAGLSGRPLRALSVTGLLHKVKVSNVRPVPARLRGTIIGKGVPGLIWSEDFVMRDATGILFLDYRQPLRIWEWLFGLFRAGDFTGKAVEVVGWFRRAPVPYLELKSITVDGVTRNSYARHGLCSGRLLVLAGLLVVAGFVRTVGSRRFHRSPCGFTCCSVVHDESRSRRKQRVAIMSEPSPPSRVRTKAQTYEGAELQFDQAEPTTPVIERPDCAPAIGRSRTPTSRSTARYSAPRADNTSKLRCAGARVWPGS